MRRSAQSFSGVVVIVIACMLSGFNGLVIHKLSIPRWVLSGSEEGVVLDCDYVLNENDKSVVVKWFFNDDVEPLYQWIPELNMRHVSLSFRNRIDMNFSINPFDPYTRYRALRIKNPTPELSGIYTCSVSSMFGQDTNQGEMTVYVPVKHFYLNYTDSDDENEMNVTCTADGVYPEPRLQLFYITAKTKHLLSAHEPQLWKATNQSTETFDVQLSKTIDRSTISENGVVVLECQLDIVGSPYRRVKRITYISADKQ